MNETKRALFYYLANQETINAGHMGDYVAIADNKVLGYYKEREDGFKDLLTHGHKLGTFNITKCHPVGEAEVYMGFVPITGDYI
ncbi:MAG: hypothetical protein LBM77_03280 [Spirochaetaceae bacterium]|jgi:hypothetical protein|nr:hypothetical protein [Spirochaetaceae bacterium]